MRTGAGERVILGLGCTLFVATAVWVATFPVTVTV
jgi:formate/nitrite transporter FocA (FNT family)